MSNWKELPHGDKISRVGYVVFIALGLFIFVNVLLSVSW